MKIICQHFWMAVLFNASSLLRKVDKKIGDKHLVISVCLLHDYELLRLFFVFQCIEYQAFQLFCQFRVILDALLCSVASLSQLSIVVAIP